MPNGQNTSNIIIILQKVISQLFVVIDDVNQPLMVFLFYEFHNFLNVEKFETASESDDFGKEHQFMGV